MDDLGGKYSVESISSGLCGMYKVTGWNYEGSTNNDPDFKTDAEVSSEKTHLVAVIKRSSEIVFEYGGYTNKETIWFDEDLTKIVNLKDHSIVYDANKGKVYAVKTWKVSNTEPYGGDGDLECKPMTIYKLTASEFNDGLAFVDVDKVLQFVVLSGDVSVSHTSGVTSITNGDVSESIDDPTKDGYEFVGWFNGGNNLTDLNIVSGRTVYKAVFNKIYTVSFAGVDMKAVSGVDGTPVNLTDPVKKGYEFAGWFLNGSKITGYTINGSDVTITAEWREVTIGIPEVPIFPVIPDQPKDDKDDKVSISFDTKGGSIDMIDESVDVGSEYVLPSYTGTKDNSIFIGWSYGGEIYRVGDTIKVTENIVLSAVWQEVTTEAEVDEEGVSMGMVCAFVVLFIVLGASYYFLTRGKREDLE